MPRPLPCVSLILSFLATCAIASADTLFLRNGTVIEGEVVRDTVDGVVFNGKIAGIWGEQFFERARVDRVERIPGDQGPGSARAAPPSLPASKPTPATPVPSNPVPASTPAAPDRPTQSGTPNQTPSNGVVEVEVTGQGATPQEAFDDALRTALREVVGAFVRSDSKVVNDQLIQDRILSHSQGFIESTEKVGDAVLKDGLYRQAAKVRVRRGKIFDALGNPGEVEVAVDGTSLYARIVTLKEQRATAQQIYDAVFEGWPANVLACQVSQAPRAMEAPPKHVQVPPGYTCMEIRVDVIVDAKRWEQWCKAASEGLSAIASSKASIKWNPKAAGAAPIEISPTKPLGQLMSQEALKAKVLALEGRPKSPSLVRPLWNQAKSLAPKDHRGMTLILLERLGAPNAQCFFLPVSESVDLGEVPSLWGVAAPPAIECSLVDAAGDSVGSIVDWPNREPMRPAERVARELLEDLYCIASPAVPGVRFESADGRFDRAARPVLVLPTLSVRSRYRTPPGDEDVQLLCPRLTFVFRFVVSDEELDQPLTARATLGDRIKQLR